MKKNKKAKKTKKKVNDLSPARKVIAKVDVEPRQSKTEAKPEEIMDRAVLKGIVGQLKAAGSDVKVLKSDTDEALQRKVNEALQRIPSEEVAKTLESIDPNKLVTVLKQDCFGLFVDFSDVSCVRCSDATACVTAFLKNMRKMPDLKNAMTDAEKPKAEPSKQAPPVTRYSPDRLVFVRDVQNPNPKGDDLHDTIRRVLDDQPETLGQLRAIVEEDFDLESDADFMKFVTALRDPKEGVIKLDADLSDADKVALRKAGYEV